MSVKIEPIRPLRPQILREIAKRRMRSKPSRASRHAPAAATHRDRFPPARPESPHTRARRSSHRPASRAVEAPAPAPRRHTVRGRVAPSTSSAFPIAGRPPQSSDPAPPRASRRSAPDHRLADSTGLAPHLRRRLGECSSAASQRRECARGAARIDEPSAVREAQRRVRTFRPPCSRHRRSSRVDRPNSASVVARHRWTRHRAVR